MSLTSADWIITIIMVVGMIWAGLYGRRLVSSVAQFTIAGRGMGTWLGLSTGAAESMGLITIATCVQNGFTSGFSWLWVTTIATIMTVVLFGILGLGIMRYRATNVHTLPQYFEMRYSRSVRIFAGISLAIGGILNMAIFPIVESHFLIAFMGLPATVSVLGLAMPVFPMILFGILFTALFFTAIGGMVSVTITEYIQAVVMFLSLTAVTILLFYRAGSGDMAAGWTSIARAVDTHVGIAAFNPFAKQSLGFAFVAALLLGTFIQRLAFPPALQKSSSAKTPKVVRQQMLLSAIFGQGRMVMFTLWGMAALVLIGPSIPLGQDPEQYRRTLGGLMLRQTTPPILMGITLAAFIFASVSTVTIYLLSWASVITNDIICTVRKRPLTTERHIWVLRTVCVTVAAVIFAWGLYYKPSEHILQWFIITGAIFGGSGIIAWFGLYWKRTTTAGAWSALLLAVVIPVGWILFQQQFPQLLAENKFAAKYLTQDNVGLFATLFPAVMLVVVSLISRKPTHFVDYGAKLREIKTEEEADTTEVAGAASV